jgi:hypothetical protein
MKSEKVVTPVESGSRKTWAPERLDSGAYPSPDSGFAGM